jgi:methionine-rich copper-binding protein CopC
VLAPSAAAHATLEQASPRVGATIGTAPREIRLVFSEGVEPALCRVTLTGRDGRARALGTPHTAPGDRRTLIVEVSESLAPDAYKVAWRVVSVDSHTTQGDFSFVLAR